MKKSIVKLLAIGMLLGGVIVPATVTDNGSTTPQITTTKTAKAATTTSDSDKTQTVPYQVYKTDTNTKSMSSQYFTDTATVTPNSDGTYKVTLTVKVPSIASVDILTMNGDKVTDSATYSKDGTTYQDVSFNVDKLSDLDGTLNSTMQIKVLGLGLMKPTADFKFDTSNLKDVAESDSDSDTNDDSDSSTDTNTDPGTDTNTNGSGDESTGYDGDYDPIIADPDKDNGSSSSDSGSNVIVGDPETTPSTSTSDDVQEIPYSVLKADSSQGESVSTQFFTGTAKVSKNDDGTYKVMMTMTYPTSFGTQPVTIDSINGGSINADDTKTYTQGGNNYMDFSFNINSMSDLDNLIPCTMTIDVSSYGFNATESVNFKFNSTSSGVAGSSTTGTGSSATNPSGVYGSTSDWPSSTGTDSTDPTSSTDGTTPSSSTDSSTLPQTGNATNSVVLTVIGLAVASMSIVLFKKLSDVKA